MCETFLTLPNHAIEKRYLLRTCWHTTIGSDKCFPYRTFEGLFCAEGGLMGRQARSRLKALPILNTGALSLRCTISDLICISEPAPEAVAGMLTVKAALDKLSDFELERHTKPQRFTALCEAGAYMTIREAQSSEYLWRQQGHCLFLLDRSASAESTDVPGVALEFVTRTGVSVWTFHRVPDPCDILERPAYFERNELLAHSQRALKSPKDVDRQFPRDRKHRLGRVVSRIAATLFA